VIDKNLLMSSEQLLTCIHDERVRVVDCRFSLLDPEAGRTQYLESHIPNAVFADLDKDLASPVIPGSGRHPLPDPAVFAATLGRLGISRDTHVVAYDQASGALAARLWWLLRWAGHDNASVLNGGFAKWQLLELPLEQGQQGVTETNFHAAPRSELVLETEEIEVALPDVAALRLVDVREAGRFEGVMEPIDTVAGHIPGALNLPFADSLHEDGTWRSPEALREQLEKVLGDGLGSPWSAMCGSGVTACHVVISGLLAGLPEPRVYVGSWSEWIQDSARPVAKRDSPEA
jgi:thiosulfate/3-mercaptopyruvate sulfurtransferase